MLMQEFGCVIRLHLNEIKRRDFEFNKFICIINAFRVLPHHQDIQTLKEQK